MKVHKLVDALSGIDPITMIYDGYGPETIPAKLLPQLKDDLVRSHKFEMGHGFILLSKDLVLTGEEGILSGFIRLPFPVTYFEFDIPENEERYGVLALEFNDSAYSIIVHPFVYKRDSAIGWIDIGILFVVDVTQEDPEKRYQSQPLMDADKYIDLENAHEIALRATTMMIGGLAAINARGVTLESVPEPVKLNKSRAKRGATPIFEYKIVNIEVPASHSSVADGSGQRLPPRLHWRRGHTRTLSSGKKTFVRPAVIGSASRGVIDKDYKR